MFGSFYRGYYVLHELLKGGLSEQLEVVGVATDDAAQGFVSPGKRVWQYPHAPEERTMVQSLAVTHGIEVYSGRVKTPEFYARMQNRWKPDLCIMATFGQKISPELFDAPRLGFYNLHPCIDDAWPSRYVGGNPFQALLDSHKPYTVIAMHRVDGGFDTGELIAYSERIAIPPHVGVVDLHKITSPVAGWLAAAQIRKIIDRDQSRQAQ
jgi:methionyl-tRNA formyltransferase